MDCSPPGSSVPGDSPGKRTGVGCHSLSRRSSPARDQAQVSCTGRQILYCLSHQGSPCSQEQWLNTTSSCGQLRNDPPVLLLSLLASLPLSLTLASLGLYYHPYSPPISIHTQALLQALFSRAPGQAFPQQTSTPQHSDEELYPGI